MASNTKQQRRRELRAEMMQDGITGYYGTPHQLDRQDVQGAAGREAEPAAKPAPTPKEKRTRFANHIIRTRCLADTVSYQRGEDGELWEVPELVEDAETILAEALHRYDRAARRRRRRQGPPSMLKTMAAAVPFVGLFLRH